MKEVCGKIESRIITDELKNSKSNIMQSFKKSVFSFYLLVFSLNSFYFLVFSFSLSAQTVNLSLNRTIEIASDSSLQAYGSKNQYQASYWAFRTYRAARLPSLNLKMTPLQYYRDIVRRYDSQNNLDIYREQQSLYSSGNLSIRQNVDLTGGTFFIDSDLGFIRNFGGDFIRSQYTSVPIRVGYSQSLFGFNSFKWEKQIEPLKYDKATKKFLYDREAISEVSTQYFFDLALAQTEYNMAKDYVAQSDTFYRIGEERFKIASISQNDLLTLQLDALNYGISLKNAEINLKRAMSAFVSFLNMEKETNVRLELPDRPKDMNISVDDALAHARENNPDFLSYRQDILEAEREVDRTQKNAVFDATFHASVGFNNTAETFLNAYRKPLQQNIVSIGLSIPLMDWGVRKGRVNMARNNLNVTKISIQQREINLEQDIVMTVNDFNIQQDMIRRAEEALRIANMAYNTTKERFIIGRADLNSLTLSQNRQKEAQKNYIYSLKNYWMSYYKIRKLTLFDFERNERLRVVLN